MRLRKLSVLMTPERVCINDVAHCETYSFAGMSPLSGAALGKFTVSHCWVPRTLCSAPLLASTTPLKLVLTWAIGLMCREQRITNKHCKKYLLEP
mmetsp:Transcript_80548/g.159525  ORF Transcript_80548/g.159525 Transcript_80548/m.159525 type:complete len:95 (+) Transcript_80548:526-810(+)